MVALQGKVAVVTGASKGMGRSFVAALLGCGMKVGALARPSQELDSLAGEFGDAIAAVPCDVADPDAVRSAFDAVATRFGQIDVLVNNAAIYHPFSFEDGSDAIIRSHVDVNLLGLAWATRAAIPHLRRTRGQIVNISSESVRHPFPMLALYAASKAAVEVLSEGLREELRSEGIRVSVLRSGSVSGGSGSESWSDETKQKFYAKIVQTGHAAMTGSPSSPESMAQGLVSIVSLPCDVSVDLVELRSAVAGMPDAPG